MQFKEPMSTKGKCPVCGKETVKRSTREAQAYSSRVCKSQRTHASRYMGGNSSSFDRPTMKEKTKFQGKV